jgi:hypothetical protein
MSVSPLSDHRSVKAIAAVLRDQRKLAIANNDFAKAQIIALQLKRISAESDDSFASQQILQNHIEYDKVKESVRSEAARAYGAAIESTYAIESEFQGRIAVLISAHAEELAAHATSLAGELELSSIRGVPDSRVMMNEARTVAAFGEFDRAQSLYEESATVHEATVLARHAEIREIYGTLQRQLDDRHREDLRLNHEKKLMRVTEVALRYRRVLDKLRKQLANAAFKWRVQQNEEEEAEFFPELAPVEQELPVEALLARPKSRSSLGSPPRTGSGSPEKKVLSGRASPSGRISPRSPPRAKQ